MSKHYWQQDDNTAANVTVEHLDGLPHHLAPTPPSDHRCKAQTRKVFSTGLKSEYCACGGVRNRQPGRRWTIWYDINSRRKQAAKDRRSRSSRDQLVIDPSMRMDFHLDKYGGAD
jgi:hypothetical protein